MEKGNSKEASNPGTDVKGKRTSGRLVIDPASATDTSDVKRRRSEDEEMTGTMAEKLKLIEDIVESIIGEPIPPTEPPVVVPEMAVNEANPLEEEAPQEVAEEEKLTADIGAPSDVDFSHLHLLAETSAVAEQLLNASDTIENKK